MSYSLGTHCSRVMIYQTDWGGSNSLFSVFHYSAFFAFTEIRLLLSMNVLHHQTILLLVSIYEWTGTDRELCQHFSFKDFYCKV